jgi:ferric-dicitrate binding protein FerR (iron transport regulator)
VNIRHTRFKLGLIVVISGGAVAGAWASLNVDFSQMVHGLLGSVGINGTQHSRSGAREIIVSAGNELTIDGGTQRISPVGPEEVEKRLAWAGLFEQNGWLSFRGQTLDIVAAAFNRHNQRKLHIGDPQTGQLRVGGKFKVNDLDGFVAALGLTHGVRATMSGAQGALGDVITLSGGGSGDSGGSADIMGAPEGEPKVP